MLRRSARIRKRKACDTSPSHQQSSKIVKKSLVGPAVEKLPRGVDIASLLHETQFDRESVEKCKLDPKVEGPHAVAVKLARLNFNDLPRDAMLIIFGHFGPQQIAKQLLPVCKTWYNVGRDPIFWKNISMNLSHPSLCHKPLIPSIVSVVQNGRLLKYFNLLLNRDVSDVLECIGKNCPLLETLYLTNTSIARKEAVQTFVSGCHLLKHLILTLVSGPAVEEFGGLISLVRLDLVYVENLTKHFLLSLSSNCVNLEVIYLQGNDGLKNKHMVPFIHHLVNVSNLYFWEHIPRCTSRTFKKIAECATLKYLCIHNAQLVLDEDMKALENLKTLHTIVIWNAWNVSSDAWISFITNLCSDHIVCASFMGCPGIDETLEDVLFTRQDTILHRAASVNLNACHFVTDRLVELILFGNPALEMFCVDNKGFHGNIFDSLDTNFAPKLRILDLPYRFYTSLPHLEQFLSGRPNLLTCAAASQAQNIPQKLLSDPGLPEWARYL